MLVYLAIVRLLPGVSGALIRTANEVQHIYHKDRQVRQVCFDRVDPRTGVSDCPSKAALCNNLIYQQVMWEQCPLTCGRCPGILPNSGGLSTIVSGTTCFDRVDPRTGVSDCPNKAALCNNLIYQRVMWEQCPLTCGRCPGILPNSGGVNTIVSGTTCFDRVDPRTGVSDCPKDLHYPYYDLMQVNTKRDEMKGKETRKGSSGNILRINVQKRGKGKRKQCLLAWGWLS
ncbi:unnamed protein product [Cylicocyclus nassatus]|uniref:ShKT domain-containing protein n=1 Tax=Cylicocyclus nassatus TaxID=53992 RepID=A0AA36GJG9_CYLNA|nr:unnamed protein product [Cylicocyclus nassatus]